MERTLVALVLGTLIGVVLWRWWQTKRDRHSRRFIAKRAQAGETGAEKLLRQHGYTILDAQVKQPVGMTVNGRRYESFIKIDYLVQRGGRVYLVEVKTGKQANVLLPNVRRQLYEYQNIFRTDGILFIDMNKYDIIEVAFDDTDSRDPSLKAFLGGILLGVLLTVFIYSYHV